MRMLLALVLVALGGVIIWHGFAKDGEAKAEYGMQTGALNKLAPDFTKLHQNYPYSNSAIDARQITLDMAVTKDAAAAPPGKDELGADLKKVWQDLPDNTKKGISTEMPFVQPYAAAIIGIAGLLLAVILPGTRLRGLAFLSLLLGAAAALAGMLPLEHQVGLVNKFALLKPVIYNFPRVAQACVALAAITLAIRAPARAPRPT
jgi:hypothetical protein